MLYTKAIFWATVKLVMRTLMPRCCVKSENLVQLSSYCAKYRPPVALSTVRGNILIVITPLSPNMNMKCLSLT
jgi:hypothetical protein